MDPNATLASIDVNVRRIGTVSEHWSDGDVLDELVDALAVWLASGGFAPDWDRYEMGASYYRARTASIRAGHR